MQELSRFYSDPVKGVSEREAIVYREGHGCYVEMLLSGKLKRYKETRSREEAEEMAEDWVMCEI